ncbi:unnamed protein product, partial [marine sediment metagenome]
MTITETRTVILKAMRSALNNVVIAAKGARADSLSVRYSCLSKKRFEDIKTRR